MTKKFSKPPESDGCCEGCTRYLPRTYSDGLRACVYRDLCHSAYGKGLDDAVRKPGEISEIAVTVRFKRREAD